jgi:hypothetical protein
MEKGRSFLDGDRPEYVAYNCAWSEQGQGSVELEACLIGGGTEPGFVRVLFDPHARDQMRNRRIEERQVI